MDSSQPDQASTSQVLEDTANVEAKNVPPVITSPKKPIQLGVVQSSSGVRSFMGNLLKKSRWDQAPRPDEDEEDTEKKTHDEKSSSVKHLIQKFEDITGVNKTDDVAQNEKEDPTIPSTTSTPSRVKLVRTNFMKTEKPSLKSSTTIVHSSSTSDTVSNVNDTADGEYPKADTKHLSKDSTDTTDKPEVSEILPVTASKALQIISSCYDSPTDESSQEGPLSSKDNTPADSAYASLEKLTDGEYSNKNSSSIVLNQTIDLDSNTKMVVDTQSIYKGPISNVKNITLEEEKKVSTSTDRINEHTDIDNQEEQNTKLSLNSENTILTCSVSSENPREAETDEKKITDPASECSMPKPENESGLVSKDHVNKTVEDKICKDQEAVSEYISCEDLDDNNKITNHPSTTLDSIVFGPNESDSKCATDKSDSTGKHITMKHLSKNLEVENVEHIKCVNLETESKTTDKQNTTTVYPSETNESKIIEQTETVPKCITSESVREDDTEITMKHPSFSKEDKISLLAEPVSELVTNQSNINDNIEMVMENPVETKENSEHNMTVKDCVTSVAESEAFIETNAKHLNKTDTNDMIQERGSATECATIESNREDAIKVAIKYPNESKESQIIEQTQSVPEVVSYGSNREDAIEMPTLNIEKIKKDNIIEQNVSDGATITLETGSETDNKTTKYYVSETERDEFIDQTDSVTQSGTSKIRSEDAIKVMKNPAETKEHHMNEHTEHVNECEIIQSKIRDVIRLTPEHVNDNLEEDKNEDSNSVNELIIHESQVKDEVEMAANNLTEANVFENDISQHKSIDSATETANDDINKNRKLEEETIIERVNVETTDTSLKKETNKQEMLLNSQIDSLPIVFEKSSSTTKETVKSYSNLSLHHSIDEDQLLTKPTMSVKPHEQSLSKAGKYQITDDGNIKSNVQDSEQNSKMLADDVPDSMGDKIIKTQIESDITKVGTIDSKVYDDGVDATMEKMFSEDLVSPKFVQESNETTEDNEHLSQDKISDKVPAFRDEVINQSVELKSSDNLLKVLEADHSENSNDNCDKTHSEIEEKEKLHTKISEKTKLVALDIMLKSEDDNNYGLSKEIDLENKNICISNVEPLSNEMPDKLLETKDETTIVASSENTVSIQENIDKGSSTVTKSRGDTDTSDNTIFKNEYVENKILMENLEKELDKKINSSIEIMLVSSKNNSTPKTLHVEESLESLENVINPIDKSLEAKAEPSIIDANQSVLGKLKESCETKFSCTVEGKNKINTDIVVPAETSSENVLGSTQMKEVSFNIEETENEMVEACSEQQDAMFEDINETVVDDQSESLAQNPKLISKIITDCAKSYPESIVVSENLKSNPADKSLDVKKVDECKVEHVIVGGTEAKKAIIRAESNMGIDNSTIGQSEKRVKENIPRAKLSTSLETSNPSKSSKLNDDDFDNDMLEEAVDVQHAEETKNNTGNPPTSVSNKDNETCTVKDELSGSNPIVGLQIKVNEQESISQKHPLNVVNASNLSEPLLNLKENESTCVVDKIIGEKDDSETQEKVSLKNTASGSVLKSGSHHGQVVMSDKKNYENKLKVNLNEDDTTLGKHTSSLFSKNKTSITKEEEFTDKEKQIDNIISKTTLFQTKDEGKLVANIEGRRLTPDIDNGTTTSEDKECDGIKEDLKLIRKEISAESKITSTDCPVLSETSLNNTLELSECSETTATSKEESLFDDLQTQTKAYTGILTPIPSSKIEDESDTIKAIDSFLESGSSADTMNKTADKSIEESEENINMSTVSITAIQTDTAVDIKHITLKKSIVQSSLKENNSDCLSNTKAGDEKLKETSKIMFEDLCNSKIELSEQKLSFEANNVILESSSQYILSVDEQNSVQSNIEENIKSVIRPQFDDKPHDHDSEKCLHKEESFVLSDGNELSDNSKSNANNTHNKLSLDEPVNENISTSDSSITSQRGHLDVKAVVLELESADNIKDGTKEDFSKSKDFDKISKTAADILSPNIAANDPSTSSDIKSANVDFITSEENTKDSSIITLESDIKELPQALTSSVNEKFEEKCETNRVNTSQLSGNGQLSILCEDNKQNEPVINVISPLFEQPKSSNLKEEKSLLKKHKLVDTSISLDKPSEKTDSSTTQIPKVTAITSPEIISSKEIPTNSETTRGLKSFFSLTEGSKDNEPDISPNTQPEYDNLKEKTLQITESKFDDTSFATDNVDATSSEIPELNVNVCPITATSTEIPANFNKNTTKHLKRTFSLSEDSKKTDISHNKLPESDNLKGDTSQIKKRKVDDILVSEDRSIVNIDANSSEIPQLNENITTNLFSSDEIPTNSEKTRSIEQPFSLSEDSIENETDNSNICINKQQKIDHLKEETLQIKKCKVDDIPISIDKSIAKSVDTSINTSEITEKVSTKASSFKELHINVETAKSFEQPLSFSEDSKGIGSAVSNISLTKHPESHNLKENIPQTKEPKVDEISILPDILTEHSAAPTTQISELVGKASPKTSSPKEVPAPVRVSARQKQRQAAAAAALAADQKVKSISDSNVKKGIIFDKNSDKRVRKSTSPTKELQVKISPPKLAESENQPSPGGQKSPKTTDYRISSQVSPKKPFKDVARDKLEPITLKLSKEDNPVIIRSSSLSPKKVLSPQSPQTKTLGYTLKIGKDSTTIIPKDPTLSPKPRDSSPNTSTGKLDISGKVGYTIKDTSLTITPVVPDETQDQKLNKITLKLSKAGGHPEIKQEKHETWKAIKKLGEIDIVPVEGKVSSDIVKKEKSEPESSEKKLKLGDVTVEPSSSNLSKLQGLLTQAPLNQSDDSNDVQFVGFAPPSEQNPSSQQISYDIGLVKQEPDSQNTPKRRGRPRKMLSPGEMTHSISQSLPPGLTAKDILAASLQHQTLQHHIQQMQQPIPYVPQQEEECSAPMFPVPLFDLSEDTFMDPSPPTIFPDQVQPEMIMRSARGRPIGRSRRSRGSGLLRASERGPRGRPRGSRGLKRMLAEMEALSYPDMEQPITLDNIDSEIGPREHTVSQITETTMALLRKSIEGKSLEKRARKSDGSEDENRDRELDAKVREMKEKIEAAYQAELRSPGKVTPEKDIKKKTLEKCDIREMFRKGPPELIPLNLKGDINRASTSKEGEEDHAKPTCSSFSGIMGTESFKRKSTDEHPESSKKICKENNETFSSEGEIGTSVGGSESATNQMDVDQLSVTENQEGVKSEPEPPPKPVKPRPKTKAEIKRIKREKDRIRREAKKLAALEALKAPPPNPCEEDTRMSATDPNGDGDDPLGTGIKKNRMEVGDPEGKEFTVEQIAEYQWPLQGGELYMIQEQISTYLGVKSFKRKYPDLKRRPVEMEERTFLCDSGLVSESMCDLGLTAVSSSEVLDIMFQDFQDQYEELRKHMREKQARELINKQKERKKFEQSLSKSDLKEQAIQSSMSWNQALNKCRTETRKCHLDLQTWTIQYPRNKAVTMTKPTPKLGNYPVALIPGQYADYYKRYTPQELRYWPVNTVLYGPLQPNERHSTGGSEGSQSESEDSSSSDDSSDSSSDGEEDCKVCGGGKRSGGAMVQCSQCGHNSTTASVWA